VDKSKAVITGIKDDLEHVPGEENKIIKVLNSKTKEELEEFGIEDRTNIVLEVRRVLTKKNLLLQLESKCQNLEARIIKFHRKFNTLQQKGLQALRHSTDQLIPLEDYQYKLHQITTHKTKFSKVKGTINGKAFLEGLKYDLFIQHEVSHLFITRPTFEKYIEVDEAYKKVTKFSIPDEKRWDRLLELIE